MLNGKEFRFLKGVGICEYIHLRYRNSLAILSESAQSRSRRTAVRNQQLQRIVKSASQRDVKKKKHKAPNLGALCFFFLLKAKSAFMIIPPTSVEATRRF